MTLRQRIQAARREDRGAALVIALIFVTVVAVTIAAVLAYVDANMRATVALREQAAVNAAADAAAELAINQLRKTNYTGGSCSGFDLNAFPGPAGEVNSARVLCAPDPDTSQSPSTGTPSGYALLALQSNMAAENSVDIKVNGSGAGLNVAGDVGSAGRVLIDHGTLNVAGSLTAKDCGGSVVASGTRVCGPSAPSLTDPDYPIPTYTATAGSVTGCSGTKRTFQPGVYNTLSVLNDAWSTCGAATVFDFRPGIYYFGYSGVWRINRGTMVAGAASALGTTPPSIPGACPNPLTSNIGTAGVTFVFGNDAQMLLTGTARMEICAREAPTGSIAPPIALYGLDTGQGSGPLQVQSQRQCVTRFSGGGNRCPVFSTDNQADTVRYYIQGHVYQPQARVDLDLRKSSDQFLNGGVTVRAFNVFSPASSTPPTPVSSGPILLPQPGRTMVMLTVYVCAGASSCPSGGRVRLRVKVAIGDPDGTTTPGNRTVTVYNWGVVR